MEVVVEWKFGNGSTYNGSVQWMTLPSHRMYVYVCMYMDGWMDGWMDRWMYLKLV